MKYVHQEWPCWMVGPNGEKRIFPDSESVPVGWRTKDEAAKGDAGITYKPPVPATVASEFQETPKQRAARKAREARAAKKAAAG